MRSIVGAPSEEIRSVAIVGAGRIGQRLVELIAPGKRSSLSLTLIEKDEARARQAAMAYPHILVIEGDATKIDVLRDEGGASSTPWSPSPARTIPTSSLPCSPKSSASVR